MRRQIASIGVFGKPYVIDVYEYPDRDFTYSVSRMVVDQDGERLGLIKDSEDIPDFVARMGSAATRVLHQYREFLDRAGRLTRD